MAEKPKSFEISLDLDLRPGRSLVYANKFRIEKSGRSIVAHFSYWSASGKCGTPPVSVSIGVAEINRGRASLEGYYATVFASGRDDEGSFDLLFDELGEPVAFANLLQVTRLDDLAELRFLAFSLQAAATEAAKKVRDKLPTEAVLEIRCEVEMQLAFLSTLLNLPQ